MKYELKPCPFCGYKAILQTIGNEYHGMCNNPNCYAVGKMDTSKRRAIKAWNTRVGSKNDSNN